jgi:hypothetical protein
MKSRLFKTCLTSLALSFAGLASAETIFTEQLTSHAAISAAAISIATDAFVDGHIASQAAVTTGAGSEIKNIVSSAATGIGADARTCDIYAGAAIAVGAGSKVGALTAGGAITLGALAERDVDCGSEATVVTSDFDAANAQIKSAQSALDAIPATGLLYAYMFAGNLEPGVYEGGAITIPANTVTTFDANGQNGVWIFKLSGAMTVGAGSQFEIINAGDNNAVIWDIEGALTLGAGSSFLGTAFIEGAVSGATATVSCGNLYATGAISIGSIGSIGGDDCKVSADQLADFSIEGGEYKLAVETYEMGGRGPAGGWVIYTTNDGRNGIEAASKDVGLGPVNWGCKGVNVTTESSIGSGQTNTNNILASNCTLTNTAAKYADKYEEGGYDDWYLPSNDELALMNSLPNINNKFGIVYTRHKNFYWTSTQRSGIYAEVEVFGIQQKWGAKIEGGRHVRIRAMRTF